jgi:FRG domain
MSLEEYGVYVEDTRMRLPPSDETLEYLAYLRHHGFPSPLLDWSQSPFVAAYFALGQAAARTVAVAVYGFIEHAGFGKGSMSSEPSIHTIGSSIRAHRRHFLQQSEYTYCVVRKDGGWHYANHETAIGTQPDDPQDLLYKFYLPTSERSVALKHLDKFNLNAFSLLGSDESLMETTAFRTLGDDA